MDPWRPVLTVTMNADHDDPKRALNEAQERFENEFGVQIHPDTFLQTKEVIEVKFYLVETEE